MSGRPLTHALFDKRVSSLQYIVADLATSGCPFIGAFPAAA
jgi:hypothetical protein